MGLSLSTTLRGITGDPSPIYSITGSIGYLILSLLILLASYKTQLGAIINNISEGQIQAEYDFIVVGAGSSGATVAARLSENSNVTVLLLEVGDLATPFSYIPLMAQFMQKSRQDWQFQTEPQNNCARGLNDQRVNFPQGQAVGGSSVINYMLYTRGNRFDYDGWAAMGNPGWSYNDVLKYFLKLENNENLAYTQTPFHATGGPMNVEDLNYKTPLADAYLQAAREMNFPIGDINDDTLTGFTNPQGTTKDGQRFNVARAYLEPAKDRPNLHVSMLSVVSRVIIDPITKRATGVEFTRSGTRRIVYARKEVILSAGALQSPKLLMLSGVGPNAELNKFGIPVIKDLPVGQKLYDHVTTGIPFLINQPVSFIMGKTFENSIINFYNFFFRKNGELTSLGAVEGIGFLKTKYAVPLIDYPDCEFIISSGAFNSDGGARLWKNYNLRPDFYKETFGKFENRDAINIFVVLSHPRSYGNVTLRSLDPLDAPIIQTNYYKDPQDMKVMVEGIKLALKFAETPTMQKFGATLMPSIYPACRDFVIGSDEFCECYARELTGSFWHLTTTCKMGPPTDPEAVVDPRLRVHGISGLRVVDSGIMPYEISAHTNVPCVMIGEKAADMIKEDHGLV